MSMQCPTFLYDSKVSPHINSYVFISIGVGHIRAAVTSGWSVRTLLMEHYAYKESCLRAS